MTHTKKLLTLYETLFNEYGPQGWWPLLKQSSTDLKNIYSFYHSGDYSYPKNKSQKFEICVGAILTQNTSWKNVEKALAQLFFHDAIHPKKIIQMPFDTLSTYIQSAGYYNQKSKKLKIFSEFFLSCNTQTPSRETLLSVWGIGPETADSILLYAYHIPIFVIDAYTRRILIALGLSNEKQSYQVVQNLFMDHLSHDVNFFQEYHALFVEHAKQFYPKKLGNQHDPLLAHLT